MIFATCATGLHGNFPAGPDSSSQRLKQLTRTFRNQDTYSASARYCLLAFGPEATTQIWLIVDGDKVLSVRDGQTTEHALVAESRWHECLIGDVTEANGVRHRELRLLIANGLATLTMNSNGWGLKNFNSLVTNLKLAATPGDTPIVHLGGPLAIQAALSEDDGPVYLLLDIGTPGIGQGAFAAISYSVAVQLQTRPVAEISFLGRDGAMKRERVELTYDSCVDGFHGCMRVGEGAGVGTAKITVSFADWKEAALTPCVLEVPVKRLEWPMHPRPFLGAGSGTAASSIQDAGPGLRETGLWT